MWIQTKIRVVDKHPRGVVRGRVRLRAFISTARQLGRQFGPVFLLGLALAFSVTSWWLTHRALSCVQAMMGDPTVSAPDYCFAEQQDERK